MGGFGGTVYSFPTTLKASGGRDVLVAKLDQGGKLLSATSAGGTSDDYGYGIALDSSGNVYITGEFSDKASFGSTTFTVNGVTDKSTDMFLAKLDTNGKFLWATSAGGAANDHGWAVAIDGAGSAYTTGGYEGTAGFGKSKLTSKGKLDIFIWKHGKIP